MLKHVLTFLFNILKITDNYCGIRLKDFFSIKSYKPRITAQSSPDYVESRTQKAIVVAKINILPIE